MSNDIPKRQNDLVELVRASPEVYRQAKGIGGVQLGLSLAAAVGGPVVVAIVTYFHPPSASAAKAWVGLFAIAAVVIDAVFLGRSSRSCRRPVPGSRSTTAPRFTTCRGTL